MNKVDSILKQKDTESTSEYINRICSNKKHLSLTWAKVTELLNSELNCNYSESWYRKNFVNGSFNKELNETDGCIESDSYDEDLELTRKLHQLRLKKAEIADLVSQNNAYIRRLAREDTIKEIAHDYATIMSDKKLLECPLDIENAYVSEKEGILLLSDWHYGMVCDNPWNKFDPDICRYRVSKLLSQVIKHVIENEISRVHVLDLADLIAGRIHTQIRIESRFDVITQTMDVAEILAEFLNELSHFCNISFYSCLDNHSRLEPNKKESMDLESLARLIPWYLKERLADNYSVEICENEYGADIITCDVLGHRVIGVHGDNDQPKTALERLSLMTHEHYNMLCTAHLHHFSCDEDHQTIVIGNASLMGVDRYAEKLRLTSDPSQTLILATPENICEAIFRIKLD